MQPAFNTIYTKYSDEVARLADSIDIENDTSPSLSGGDDYAPSTLIDDNPAKVAKINDTSGAWVLSYSAKQRIRLVVLIHGTFDETVDNPGSPAPSVRFEGNNTNDFTSPAFSAPIIIPPWLGAGTGRWPQNPWLDLTSASGYDDDGFFYWRLVAENQSQNIQLGQLILSATIRQFDPDLRWGVRVGARKPLIENVTAFEVSTMYSRGTTLWKASAELRATDAMATAFEDHWYDVDGRARPFALIPSGPIRDDRAYMVRYAMTDREIAWNSQEHLDKQLAFAEVGRGLRPGV